MKTTPSRTRVSFKRVNCLLRVLLNCGVSFGTSQIKETKTKIVRPEIIQKLSCHEKVVLITVPIGIPITEAILKPAKTQETRLARFYRGATKLAITNTIEIIAPATVAVNTREKSIEIKLLARAVQVLPIKNTTIKTSKTWCRRQRFASDVIIGVKIA